MTWKNVEPQELRDIYNGITLVAEAECEFTTDFVGGQPADDKGLEAFCRFHLKLTDDEIPAAVARIKGEELAKPSTGAPTPNGEAQAPEGELKEAESYAVCSIRHCEAGPWLGDWQIKACLKCAATRVDLFSSKKGAKGDMSHLGSIRPIGASKACEHAGHIHLYTGDPPFAAPTQFKKYMGSVHGAQGRVSIVHDSEIALPGTRFAFQFRVPPLKFDETALKLLFATIPIIGLGSVKALENGKFRVLSLRYDIPEIKRKEKEKK